MTTQPQYSEQRYLRADEVAAGDTVAVNGRLLRVERQLLVDHLRVCIEFAPGHWLRVCDREERLRVTALAKRRP
jgi:hypothetical protein